MEYMATVPDKYFDLAIVDPPYGMDRKMDGTSGAGRVMRKWKRDGVQCWDIAPTQNYWMELFRISKNQIVWGANHFISKMPFDSSCWLMWDKGFSEELTFAQFELAWTSFKTTCKKFNKTPNEHGRIHPTQKPVALYNWLLTNYAKKGQRVLDTHLGSGSSAIAAHYFGVDFVGCELDKDYFEAAKARFDMATRQLALSV